MKYFKLPDLGEGLQEAEIVEWHASVGELIKQDQLLVSVETAKAIVEVPSPCDGIIAKQFGQVGDLIHIGEPLLEFETNTDNEAAKQDNGTVVGEMKTAQTVSREDSFIIGSAHKNDDSGVQASPAIRSLAQRLEIDLSQLKGSGRDGLITTADLESAAQIQMSHGQAITLKGVRRSMAKNLSLAHQQVVPVSIFDAADISKWSKTEDATIRLAKAIGYAAKKEPIMNAWFDGETMSLRLLEKVELGIAVDTKDGLFVPVLRNITNRSSKNLRKGLDQLRKDVEKRSIPPQELQGASIMLSNFGAIAGRYATPMVIPPCVSIVGAGKIYDEAHLKKGDVCMRAMLPLSITFDHRAITGGEAARFLSALMKHLQKKSPPE